LLSFHGQTLSLQGGDLMNKKVPISVFSILLVTIFLSSCISPTFALTEFYEYQPVSGTTIIDIPDVTPENGIKISFGHYDKTSDHGARDEIAIYLWTEAHDYVLVGFYSDTSEGVDYIETVTRPLPTDIKQLKWWQLNVFGYRKTAIACWTVPLEIPAINWFGAFTTPAVTIPPGCLIIKGYDEPIFETRTMSFGPSGFTAVNERKYYEANGCFICPQWRFWGATTGATRVTQQSWAITGP
jgi:hypothetical protein